MSLKSFNSEYLKPFLHQLSSENKQLILLGDFNVNLLKVRNDPETSTFLDALCSNLLLPQILLPTRITGDSHTLTDNIFSNASNSNIAGNICFSISDHLPQFCIFDLQIKSKGRDVVYKQDWSHFDSTAFTADFSAIDWDSQFENCNYDPNLCFNNFDLKIKALVDRHLPIVRLTKRQRKTQLKPWITTGIVKAISKRDFFFRKS